MCKGNWIHARLFHQPSNDRYTQMTQMQGALHSLGSWQPRCRASATLARKTIDPHRPRTQTQVQPNGVLRFRMCLSREGDAHISPSMGIRTARESSRVCTCDKLADTRVPSLTCRASARCCFHPLKITSRLRGVHVVDFFFLNRCT